jgi:hypothetical protein
VEFRKEAPTFLPLSPHAARVTSFALEFRQQVTYLCTDVSIEPVPSTFTAGFIILTMEAACLVAGRHMLILIYQYQHMYQYVWLT